MLISTTTTANRLGVSRSTVERLRRNPSYGFPCPIYISPNCVRFDSEEIARFIELRKGVIND